MTAPVTDRASLIRKALLLAYFIIAWDVIEGMVAVTAGILANSVALIGFGIDSGIEVFAAIVTAWYLRGNGQRDKKLPLRLIAVSFFVLAAYVGFKAISDLLTGSQAEPSTIGIVWSFVALAIMVPIALVQRKTGIALNNKVIISQADQTWLSNYLSLSLLIGLGVNALWGWWWADPIVALVLAFYSISEGVEAWEEAEKLET
ncbi:MAG TPA: cation transporter [Patescibacteria group bacterium]